jgi:alpha-aminoadipic semialdehyde synthase
VKDGHTGQGIVVLAIDNLPCELPRDSSTFFSHQLAPLLPDVLRADYSQPLERSGLPSILQKAVIVYNGSLTESYRYLGDHLPI